MGGRVDEKCASGRIARGRFSHGGNAAESHCQPQPARESPRAVLNARYMSVEPETKRTKPLPTCVAANRGAEEESPGRGFQKRKFDQPDQTRAMSRMRGLPQDENQASWAQFSSIQRRD